MSFDLMSAVSAFAIVAFVGVLFTFYLRGAAIRRLVYRQAAKESMLRERDIMFMGYLVLTAAVVSTIVGCLAFSQQIADTDHSLAKGMIVLYYLVQFLTGTLNFDFAPKPRKAPVNLTIR